MSLVIAVRDKDRVVLGSDTQASTNTTKEDSAIKIWEVRELPGAIMGSVGSCRATQVIQYNKLIDWDILMSYGDLDTAFIVKHIVPAIVATLTGNGIYCGGGPSESDAPGPVKTDIFLPNAFIFAFGNCAWMIYHDLSVMEMNDYLCIGSGSEVSQGALYATKDKNPFERIKLSIEAASLTTLFVNNNINFLTTKYYKKDDVLINRAFGVEEIKPIKEIELIEEEPVVEKPKKSKKKKVEEEIQEKPEKKKKEKSKK